jgi:hypothetical protein
MNELIDFAQFVLTCDVMKDSQIVNEKTLDEYRRRLERVNKLKDIVDEWRTLNKEFDTTEIEYITAKNVVRLKLFKNGYFNITEIPYCDLDKTIKSYKDKIRYEKLLYE